MSFMDNNFMLHNDSARALYEEVKDLPIYDFHCHLDPQEIYEDKPFNNIVEMWLGGDHYKWRLMRANGVAEQYITGDADDKAKFEQWAKTLSKAIGNPLYHWTHLEMKRIFGISEPLTADNWEEMYERMNKIIADQGMSPHQLIKDAKVAFVGTTDHPLDDLEWHKKLAADDTLDTVVAPTFRPDEVFVDHANFKTFVERLSEKESLTIDSFDAFVDGLDRRIEFFESMGARASDLSLGQIVYAPAESKEQLDAIFNKALNGEVLTKEEIDIWQTEILVALTGMYKSHHLVAQVHFGALRNNNSDKFAEVGADSGFDSMGDQVGLGLALNQLLDRLNTEDKLPKMVWYNLNPEYNTILANTVHNFEANEEGVQGKVQFGAAWWFADTAQGMRDQMETLAQQGILANFIGMLTDSRSFLSYPRHDYFRRILCQLVGEWVDREEIPNNTEWLSGILSDICYNNAAKFFNE